MKIPELVCASLSNRRNYDLRDLAKKHDVGVATVNECRANRGRVHRKPARCRIIALDEIPADAVAADQECDACRGVPFTFKRGALTVAPPLPLGCT